jgi:hypothetical protein
VDGGRLTPNSFSSNCHLKTLVMAAGPRYVASVRTVQKTPLRTLNPLLHITQPLPSNGCFSGSTVLGLSTYATILNALSPRVFLIHIDILNMYHAMQNDTTRSKVPQVVYRATFDTS